MTTVNARFDYQVSPGRVSFTLPLKTLSEANVSEHWSKRASRHKEQKAAVNHAMNLVKSRLRMPCTITCKRYGKRLLDAHDNLPISFKHILDQICVCITGDKRPGRADGHQGFTFRYDQEKSKEYFIKITIDF